MGANFLQDFRTSKTIDLALKNCVWGPLLRPSCMTPQQLKIFLVHFCTKRRELPAQIYKLFRRPCPWTPPGRLWTPPGRLWTLLDASGRLWKPLDASWTPLDASWARAPGGSWVVLEAPGGSWTLLGAPGRLWTPPGRNKSFIEVSNLLHRGLS
mgnify:CR=1 FL=1